MRVRTLVGWSLMSMLCSSLAVLAFTNPPAGPPSIDVPAAAALTAQLPDEPESQFEVDGSVKVSARVGHRVLGADGSKTYALFELEGPEEGTAETAGRIDLRLVVDRSGSMKGQRLVNAKAAARAAVKRLRAEDRVTLIAYDAEPEVLLRETPLSPRGREALNLALDRLVPKGATCISCALESTMGMSSRKGSTIEHVVLLSDGEPTRGLKGTAELEGLARRARRMGMSVSSVGVDVDYNEKLLAALALASNGEHYFAPDASKLESIFDQEVSRLVKASAQDVTLELELPEGVELVQVFDRAFERDGRKLEVRFGSFTPRDKKTLLLELKVPEGQGTVDLTSAKVGYTDLRTGKPVTWEKVLSATRSGDPSQVSELDPVVAARAAQSETAALLRDTNQLFKTGKLEDVEKRFEQGLAKLDAVEKSIESTNAAPASKARSAANVQGQKSTLKKAKDKFRAARATKCACAPTDLMCAMKCGGGADTRDEKSVAKENEALANPYSK